MECVEEFRSLYNNIPSVEASALINHLILQGLEQQGVLLNFHLGSSY